MGGPHGIRKYMVMKTALAKSERMRWQSSSRMSVHREHENILKASWHLAGGQTRVDIEGGRFTGLGLKNGGG